jgi:glycosyltransferase involved in cell wall biosynthesis
MNPYFEKISEAKNEIEYIFSFITTNHKKTHELVYQNILGVIASDIDYFLPLQNHSKFLGLVPNPINTMKIGYSAIKIIDKVIIFLGINRGTYYTKGISFFEKALEIINDKYSNKIEIIIAKNIPYKDYIFLLDKAHIVLDQVYGFDQGYNALEAMAKGKVVFTGAEVEFETHYNLTEKVAINALPNVDILVDDLSYLIENPIEIKLIGARARNFIVQEHDCSKVAEQYMMKWKMN